MGMKALLVDDNIVTRILYEKILSDRGYEVTAFGNAEDALAQYQSTFYPLLILDWMLPGMDGLELCSRIRQLPQGDCSAILIITARKNPTDLDLVLKAGADDYLIKPVDIEILRIRLAIAENQVKIHLSRKLAEDELLRSRDDMLSVLNQLNIGTVMTDNAGHITFLSRAAQKFFPGMSSHIVGQHWEKSFPFPKDSLIKLQELYQQPAHHRKKAPIHIKSTKGQLFWMEVQIEDEPQDPERKIFFFYDISEVHDLREILKEPSNFYNIIGKSEQMKQVYQFIEDMAQVNITVLIEGETGTGKEMVARAFHMASPRRANAYVAFNCAGLTESLLSSQLFGHKKGSFTGAIEDTRGLFEAADGGTIFLDEIGDIPMSVQTSLLRVLQEREITRLGETKPRKIDVRIVAATHRNLNEEVEKGNFRQDLFYRICVAKIKLPPLRERKEDIPLLLSAFLRQICSAIDKPLLEVSNEVMRLLMAYEWPGNVREFRSALEFAAIRCNSAVIQVSDLPAELHSINLSAALPPPPTSLDDERERFIKALKNANGNRSKAAQLLGISRATFYRKLVEY